MKIMKTLSKIGGMLGWLMWIMVYFILIIPILMVIKVHYYLNKLVTLIMVTALKNGWPKYKTATLIFVPRILHGIFKPLSKYARKVWRFMSSQL